MICDLQVFALCQAFVGSNLQGIVLPRPSYWGIMLKTPLIWRDRFIIFLKHAPSIWRSSFIMHLEHALSCGDSGSSSYLQHAPAPLSHIWNTHPRFFTFAKVLNPSPNFSQTRGRGRAEKESGGVWGGAAPPICNHNVSIRGSERIHMRAVFAGRMSF